MFSPYRRSSNKKPGGAGRREPGLGDDKNNLNAQNPTVCSETPQQPVVVLCPIVVPTDRGPSPELPFSEIIKYSREAIPSVSEDPRNSVLIKTLIEMNFVFEMLAWPDGTHCTVGWGPDHRRHELTDETLLMAYVVGRTALELWHFWGGAGVGRTVQ